MTITHTADRGRQTGSSLEAILHAKLGHRVRGLGIEVRKGRLYLRGKTDSFHVKQIAQHEAMLATGLPLEANEIEVVSKPQLRVVLASGDERVRVAALGRLTDMGWEVATAADGLACVAHLRQSTWNVVVLDADLLWGGADGVVADILDGSSPDLPIVFLGNPPQLRHGGNRAQVTAVLEKPFNLDILASAVEAAAGHDVALTDPPQGTRSDQ